MPVFSSLEQLYKKLPIQKFWQAVLKIVSKIDLHEYAIPIVVTAVLHVLILSWLAFDFVVDFFEFEHELALLYYKIAPLTL